MTPQEVARIMGGKVVNGAALVPGPGHSAADRSLSVKVDVRAPDGFVVHSFAGDDAIVCKDYVRQKLGLPTWQPANGADRHASQRRLPSAAAKKRMKAPKADKVCERSGDFPARTPPDENGKPWFLLVGRDGPAKRRTELRRHVYRRDDGEPVRIKIKKKDGNFSNCYRVCAENGTVGWQWQQPDGYQPVPYIAGFDPRDPELIDSPFYWPEGERDVDTLANHNLPALTFGGTGDGLPDGIEPVLHGRDIIILADNDENGREHAKKKADAAHAAGAARVRAIHFPELSLQNDVTDFFAGGGTSDELQRRADESPLWSPVTPKEEPSHGIIVRRASDIEPQAIKWIWMSRLARGKHTAIAGEPGTGKSTLICEIIAAITTGGLWPCGEGRAPLGSAVILSAEDDAEHTLVPCLMAAGADLNRVHIIEAVRSDDGSGTRSFNLQGDLQRLEKMITEIGDVLLVDIDPISSYMGKADSHKNADVRAVLEPLSKMAERTGASVLSITHFSKGGATSGAKALHRFIGSIAFSAAPRCAFAVMADPDDENRRLFLHVKNNLAAPPQGLAFRLGQRIVGDPGKGIVGSHVLWDAEPVSITANEALAAEAGTSDQKSARNEADEFLREMLADGPMPAKEVQAASKENMISTATLRRAKKALNVQVIRDGFGPGSTIEWALPAHRCSSNPIDAQPQNVSTYGENEHLWRDRENGSTDSVEPNADGLDIPEFLRRTNGVQPQ